MIDDETIWNMAQRFVRLPYIFKVALDGPVFMWDFDWWNRQRDVVGWFEPHVWNIDAVGSDMFAEVFIDPVRHLMPDRAWFDADQGEA